MAEVKLSETEFKVLLDEIRMAEARNEQELEPQMRESLERYTGVHVPDIAVDWTLVLNEIYPVIQYNLPAIFFRNPRAYLKPREKTFIAKRRDPITQKMEEIVLDSTKSARTQESILNYEIVKIRYKQETRKCLFDGLLFRFGVLWHGYKGDFGLTDENSIFIRKENVFVKRISPLRYIFDPSVRLTDLEEAKWVGRVVDIPLVDLLEDDSLDVDKNFIKGKTGYGEKIGTKKLIEAIKLHGKDYLKNSSPLKPMLDEASNFFRDSPHSKFVRAYEILHRPSPKEKRNGEKGKLILLTFEQNKPLKTNGWPYKAEGFPPKILYFNEVPDQPFPMGDPETYKSVADHKNLVLNQQIRNAEQTNKIWVAINKKHAANEEDIDKVQHGQSTVVTFEGDEDVRTKMAIYNAAGMASAELYQLDQRIDRNLQDKSGVTDLKRGFLQSGEESAESVRLRALGGSARPMYRQDIMLDFLRDSLSYLNDLIKQFTPIRKAVRIIGSPDVEWSDDFTEDEIQADVDVEIDPISVLPENPQDELQQLGQALDMAINALTNPAVMTKIQQEGKTLNLSPLIEQILSRMRLKDPDIFRNLTAEESEGFVSVSEMKAAQANVQAAMQGAEIPSPPEAGQDHRARLSIYTAVSELLRQLGQVSDLLEQLIMLQVQTMEEEETKTGEKVPKAKTSALAQPVGAK